MSSIDHTYEDEEDGMNDEGIIGEIKKFRQNHSVLFWLIIVVIVILLISVVVVLLVNRRKRKDKSEEKKEEFTASDSLSNEFDYVNSYIYSTLGESDELDKMKGIVQ